MLYLSLQDPNYRIKGSRDPLGFQPVWQRLGRTIIQHLSTVSVNVRDFQVMSFAYYLYGDDDPKQFLDFFYKWEQLCAYARENDDTIKDGYNGKNFVTKTMLTNPDGPYYISTKNEDTLLSNQKAYGVYGKYNRPYTEMKIRKQDDFIEVMTDAVDRCSQKERIYSIVQRILGDLRARDEIRTKITPEDLDAVAELFQNLAPMERKFYDRLILQGDEEHNQNELYRLLEQKEELLTTDGPFELYNVLQTFISDGLTSETLRQQLEEIHHAEKLLYIYINLFRHIQSRPIWSNAEIQAEEAVLSIPKVASYNYKDEVLQRVSNTLTTDRDHTVHDVVDRNKEICKKRNNAAWLELDGDKIRRHYQEGGRELKEWNVEEYFENDYFIAAYFRLYKQIKLGQ